MAPSRPARNPWNYGHLQMILIPRFDLMPEV